MPAAKPKPVAPMNIPPPAGSVWQIIEQLRIELRWSARTIGTKAGLSSAWYSTLARTGWGERATKGATDESRDAVIQALKEAGITEDRFGETVKTAAAVVPLGRLSTVREKLYLKHPPEQVDRALAHSPLLDSLPVNELTAYLQLEQEIELANAPLGRLGENSTGVREAERFYRDAQQLDQGHSVRRRANARK